MPSAAVRARLNQQITDEFYAAYLYLAMAAYFEEENLPGFAYWMRAQNQEEIGHAMRLFDFMLGSGGHIELGAIERPPSDFSSPRGVMEAALEHEREVTAAIIQLYELARNEKDYPAELELQWFITEQVEEERIVGEIVAKLNRIGDHAPALLMIDRELATRPAG